MKDLEWKEPPVIVSGAGKWETVVAILKKNPDRWARVVEGAKSQAAAAKLRQLKCRVQTHTITAEDGTKTYDVYAQWPAGHTKRLLEEEAKQAARPQSAVRAAVANGTALQQPAGTPPAGGGYLARRRALGIPAGGTRPDLDAD